jgi:hypothetical protein
MCLKTHPVYLKSFSFSSCLKGIFEREEVDNIMRKMYALSSLLCVAFVSFVMSVVPSADVQAVNPSSATASVFGEASTQATFVIPNHDGYGIGDCLGARSACGQSVAQTWCKSHGYSVVSGYGEVPAQDITATVNVKKASRAAYQVTCSR